MCLHNTQPITRKGYKVFISPHNGDGYHVIKQRSIEGTLYSDDWYHIKEETKEYYSRGNYKATTFLEDEKGWHVFKSKEDAKKFKNFVESLKEDGDNEFSYGGLVIKEVQCQKIFVEGYQPQKQDELWGDDMEECDNKEPNAFKCKKIKILKEE